LAACRMLAVASAEAQGWEACCSSMPAVPPCWQSSTRRAAQSSRERCLLPVAGMQCILLLSRGLRLPLSVILLPWKRGSGAELSKAWILPSLLSIYSRWERRSGLALVAT
jgi:hypothetical protein